MKVSNPVVINALLAKNADVECAVAENAAFKVGDKVVMRDGRKGEVVSSAPGPMGGEMYHIRLEDGRLTDSAERNLTAANAVANGEFYAIFRYNGGKNEAHDGPFSTIEEARKFGIQQAGSRIGVSFVGVGDEDLNYVWHNARAKNVVANAIASRRVATNAIGDSEIKQFEKECTSCISKLKELDKAIIRVQYLYSSIIRDMTIDGNVVNRVRSLHGDLHDVAWGCANKIS